VSVCVVVGVKGHTHVGEQFQILAKTDLRSKDWCVVVVVDNDVVFVMLLLLQRQIFCVKRLRF